MNSERVAVRLCCALCIVFGVTGCFGGGGGGGSSSDDDSTSTPTGAPQVVMNHRLCWSQDPSSGQMPAQSLP